jgi:hypothetical protein
LPPECKWGASPSAMLNNRKVKSPPTARKTNNIEDNGRSKECGGKLLSLERCSQKRKDKEKNYAKRSKKFETAEEEENHLSGLQSNGNLYLLIYLN